MARPLRIEYPGAFYHVFNRGLEYRNIYKNDSDFEYFLRLLNDSYKKFKIKVHSLCLMNNHYHLFVETPDGNLSRVMRHVDGVYTQTFNKRHKRVGPLLQGRYKAILVDKNSYSLELSRYIHLNPVKAGLVKNPEDWRWSSYQIFKDGLNHEDYLQTEWLLSQFSKRKKRARKLFCDFTREKIQKNWSPKMETGHNSILGSKVFIKRIQKKYLITKRDPEIPELRRHAKVKTILELEEIASSLTQDKKLQRRLIIYTLKKYSVLTLKQIAMRTGGVSYQAVSVNVIRLQESAKKDRIIRRLLDRIDEQC